MRLSAQCADNLTRSTADNWTLEDLLNYGPSLQGQRSPQEQYVSAAIGAIEADRFRDVIDRRFRIR